MNSIYLGQIFSNVTKEGIRAYENNASALDGMSAMLESIGSPERDREREQIERSADAIRTLMAIAESLFDVYEQKCEECKRLKEKTID
jgi:hypothetical protein